MALLSPLLQKLLTLHRVGVPTVQRVLQLGLLLEVRALWVALLVLMTGLFLV